MFWGYRGGAATENTPFRPRSPYGVAKATAFWQVANYREAYGLFACSGILFNHESPLRPERFVTQKIVTAACRIAQGDQAKLHLGNLDVWRDWGWAPEYVLAMYRMLQGSQAQDYVIATGKSNSLRDFVQLTFEVLGLDWQRHVQMEPALLRPTDITKTIGNPAKAKAELGWQARWDLPMIIEAMVGEHLAKANL
nr:GDP-mannose 4,6-dehydratase [Synechocystis salina]